MFSGTSRSFKWIYYVTSMYPSFMLFSARILYVGIDEHAWHAAWLPVVLVAETVLCLGLFLGLYRGMVRRYREHVYPEQTSLDHEHFSHDDIDVINGDPVSFLISNVTSVFLVGQSIPLSLLLFLGLHLLIYQVLVRGNTIQPNIFFILAGMTIYKTKRNQFLLMFPERVTDASTIRAFGTSKRHPTYIAGAFDLRSSASESAASGSSPRE